MAEVIAAAEAPDGEPCLVLRANIGGRDTVLLLRRDALDGFGPTGPAEAGDAASARAPDSLAMTLASAGAFRDGLDAVVRGFREQNAAVRESVRAMEEISERLASLLRGDR